MRYIIVSACLLLAACASFQDDLQQADKNCAIVGSMASRTACYDAQERVVWAKDSPGTLADFNVYSTRRYDLGVALDSHAITPADFNYQIALAQKQLMDAETRAAQAQAAVDAQQNAAFAQALLAGVAAQAQQRANRDAAIAQSIQQNTPKTSHTTSQTVFGQVQCTTTTY